MRIVLAGICGGLAIFIWGYISWMVLPWHNTVIERWKNEQSVAQTITSNSPISGIYIAPMKYDNSTGQVISPMIFVSVEGTGMQGPMWIRGIVSLFAQIVAACIVAWMLFRLSNAGFFLSVCFVTMFGIASALATHMPYMIWWGFDPYYTAVAMADLVIGWYFAGIIIALFYVNRTPTTTT